MLIAIHTARFAVRIEPCKWYMPFAYGQGLVSENYYDSLHNSTVDGCDFQLQREMKDASGEGLGMPMYTCEDNFCPECNDRDLVADEGVQMADFCDKSCGYCSPWDISHPGNDCAQSMLSALYDLQAKCFDPDTATVKCGTVDFNPGCACEEHSPVSGHSCGSLLERSGISFCDIGLGKLGTFKEHCQITCGVCTCPPPETGATICPLLLPDLYCH